VKCEPQTIFAQSRYAAAPRLGIEPVIGSGEDNEGWHGQNTPKISGVV